MVPPEIGPVEKVELELPGQASHELVVYHIVEDSPVASGERIPRWARPALVVRDGRSMSQHEAGPPRKGDFVYIFSSPRTIRLLDRLFASPVAIDEDDTEYFGEFVLQGDAPLAAVSHEYGMGIEPEDDQQTIGQYLSRRLGADTHRGDRIAVGRIELIVRDLSDDGTVTRVGLSVLPATRPSPIDRVRRPVRWRRKKPSAKSAV